MAATALVLGTMLATGSVAQDLPMPFPYAPETKKVSVVTTPALRSMRGVPTFALRLARKRMHDGGAVSDDELRQLARYRDGLAAQRLVRRLMAQPGADPSDIAYYSAIAVSTGRVWTLTDMIEAMRRLDPQSEPRERVQKYIEVLYAHAWAGNSLALDAVVEFNGEGRLFGALSDSTRDRILKQVEAAGGGPAYLYVALRVMDRSEMDAETRHLAQESLDRAIGSSDPGVAASGAALKMKLKAREGPAEG